MRSIAQNDEKSNYKSVTMYKNIFKFPAYIFTLSLDYSTF